MIRRTFRAKCPHTAHGTAPRRGLAAYGHDALDRVTRRNTDTFGYNMRSEVTSATLSATAWSYSYDNAGNQTTSTVASALFASTEYTANNLNQYTSILESPVQVRTPGYDLDANMVSNDVFGYAWDCENRLIAVSSNGVPIASYEYDYLHRRIGKTIHHPQSAVHSYIYDGWNLAHETIEVAGGAVSEIQYFWGNDLSGTLQGAGGVGGLLAVSIDGQYFLPCLDDNGNVTAYINESGTVVASYEYDAFGDTIAQTGSHADIFRFRFSTKYHDPEAGFYYYGRRFYDPPRGRWLNRDPIEESGGLNLYRFCHNNAINAVDLFGLNPEFGIMAGFAYKFGSDVMKPEVSINLVGSTKWSTCDHMTFSADIGHRVMVNGMIGMPRNSSRVYTETYIHVSGTYGTGSSPGLPFYFNGSQWYSALKDRHESSFSLGTTFYSSEALGENVRMANLRVQGGGRWFLNYHNDQAPGGAKLLSDGGDRGWTGGGMLGFSIGGGSRESSRLMIIQEEQVLTISMTGAIRMCKRRIRKA